MNERRDNHAWEARHDRRHISAAALPKPSMNRLIVAATIGNAFEWFDFVIYGIFAVTLSEVSFSGRQPDRVAARHDLAYIVRPLGAIIVGSCTDASVRDADLGTRGGP